jgi:hypothetical protein
MRRSDFPSGVSAGFAGVKSVECKVGQNYNAPAGFDRLNLR